VQLDQHVGDRKKTASPIDKSATCDGLRAVLAEGTATSGNFTLRCDRLRSWEGESTSRAEESLFLLVNEFPFSL
jgi:hypothetical protein